MKLAELQEQHCDYTRNTEKRFRVLRNVGEAAPFFPIEEPLLCFGSGDGFELEAWELLGYDVIGCEISDNKLKESSLAGVMAYSFLDLTRERNVYCAHTIEHVEDRGWAIQAFETVVISTICLIFPVEPNGTKNPSHLSPVVSIDDVCLGGQIVFKAERWNDEREGIIVAKYGGIK